MGLSAEAIKYKAERDLLRNEVDFLRRHLNDKGAQEKVKIPDYQDAGPEWHRLDEIRTRPIESAKKDQLPQLVEAIKDGAEAIRRERERQKIVEGWTPGHDDQHEDGELIAVAACYLDAAKTAEVRGDAAQYHIWPPRRSINFWPSSWAACCWKPSNDPIRNLEKAGALIAAEIDRLERKELHESEKQELKDEVSEDEA
jgi:hypothetical protein